MLEPHPDLTLDVIHGLGWIYLILAAMNFAWAVHVFRKGSHFRTGLGGLLNAPQDVPSAAPWALYATVLFLIGIVHVVANSDPSAFMIRLPVVFKTYVDKAIASPVVYFIISIVLFGLVVALRRWLVKSTVAWTLLNAVLLFLTLSLTDYNFRQIVGKPDNVPIVSMLFIVAFFTWIYFKRAVENDERIEQGRPLLESENNEKVLVWPDLVYTELICMVVVTVVLVAWGIMLQAPLEEPASSVRTPNPSKAPWYFLGLQEMLVYYDPWLAGVVFPSLIVVGLMAIPYIDFNKRGNGYYSFKERSFAILTFMFGFLPLWIAMIVLGTFLRGPNWNIFGIYEFWDVHKLEVLNNVNLSEMFWLSLMHSSLPVAPAGAEAVQKFGYIFYREWLGFAVVLAYFFLLPPVMARMPYFSKFFARMGFIRYMVFANLMLWMAALPIKMVLRWAFNLKYIVAIPEWFFNI
jgi:Cytochrome b(C-terminal)/b6/petD